MNQKKHQIFETTTLADVHERFKKTDDAVNQLEPEIQAQKKEARMELPLIYIRPVYHGGKYNVLL